MIQLVIFMNLGNRKYKSAFVCVLMLLIMLIWLVPVCFAVDGSEAGIAIDQAERNLNSAYARVAEADSAGADVSMLLNELNSAGIYLSGANAALIAGDFENAVMMAGNCNDAVSGVATEAANLRSYAEATHFNAVLSAVFVSIFGVMIVTVLGFMGWRYLRRKYFREFLDKRPEVNNVQ
jgi:hypothetical protein